MDSPTRAERGIESYAEESGEQHWHFRQRALTLGPWVLFVSLGGTLTSPAWPKARSTQLRGSEASTRLQHARFCADLPLPEPSPVTPSSPLPAPAPGLQVPGWMSAQGSRCSNP